MESISEQKVLLRKELISKRELLSEQEWKTKSERIREFVLESKELKESNSIHCFISMNQKKEVETHTLVKRILALGKEVVVPVTNFDDNSLIHSKLSSFDELKVNKWGVLEPGYISPVKVEDIDIVLVPLLGVDFLGNRLGYGKGFYDRFLSTFSKLKIGLVFDEFILKKIPTEPFDKKLDALISQSGIKYT